MRGRRSSWVTRSKASTNLAAGEVTRRFTTPILIVINSESRGTYFLGASSKDPVRL